MINRFSIVLVLAFILLLSTGMASAKLKREFIYREVFQFENETGDPFGGNDGIGVKSDDPFSDDGDDDESDNPFEDKDNKDDNPFATDDEGNPFEDKNDTETKPEESDVEPAKEEEKKLTEYDVRQIVQEMLGTNTLTWRGYFENQLSGYDLHRRYYLQDYNKLRLELVTSTKESDADESYANLNIAMIGQTFHGQTIVNALDYIPEKFSSLIASEDRDYYLFSFEDDFRLEVGEVVINTGRLQFRVGKIMLKSGTGYFFNPTDVFMQKNPSDPSYETPGIPAVTAEYFLEYDPPASVGAMLAFDETFRYSTKLLFFKYFLRFGDELTADTKIQYASRNEDYITDYETFDSQLHTLDQLGLDVHFNLLGFGLGFEVAYNMSSVRENWLAALSQIDYTFENGVSLIVEYYYDESGKSDESNYNFNDWMAYIFGSRLTMAQHYVTFAAQYEATINLTLSMSGFVNLSDASAALIPRADWNLMDGLQFNAYAMIPVGSDETEFGSQSTQLIVRLRYSFATN